MDQVKKVRAIQIPEQSAAIYAIRDASPLLLHADLRSFTYLMPGAFNKAWVAREIALGGKIVKGRK